MLTLAVCLPGVVGAGEQPLRLSTTDTVTVRADEAWEMDEGGGIVVEGGVRINAPRWAVTADHAELRGALEEPDMVVVDGAPARIRVVLAGGRNTVDGHSDHIEYARAENILRLDGAAALDEGGRKIDASAIEYLLSKRIFRTAGDRRVKVQVIPK
ncbi:MAG: hypothetical protein H6978_12005 [Gammaproteobacteria bacterium]|nr:hypothetical protein [Gammaproteobacteria bacterium]